MEQVTRLIAEDIRRSAGFLAVAAKHIPVDKRYAAFGGVSKSAAWCVNHCATTNHMAAGALQGIAPAQHEETTEEPADWDATVADLQASAEELASLVTGLTAEQAQQMIKMPWGVEWSAMQLAGMIPGHIMSHTGQLNYIQTILGDGEDHWE